MPSTLGSTTSTRFHYGPEAHKLAIEFEVASAQTVNKGDSVILATNGKVQLASATEQAINIIGVSLHDGIAAEFVTVVMKATCVVEGEATAATFNAGICKMAAYNGTTKNREYAVAVITALDAAVVDGTYGAQEQGVINNLRTKLEEYQLIVGHNLTQVAADGDIVKIALF